MGGQTDSQVDASLRWVAKQIRKSARKFTQVAKVENFTIIQMTWDRLRPNWDGGQTVKNLRQL